MKKHLFGLCGLFAGAAVAADVIVPQVEYVTTEGGTGKLFVSYKLDKPAVVTFDITTNGVPLNLDILGTAKGDVWRLLPAGTHAFTWKVYKSIPRDVDVADAKVRVKAWSVGQPPDYMVIDIKNTNGEIFYYETAGQLPGGIGHNDYKSTKLVMRKIPAAYKWSRLGRLGVADGNTDTPRQVLLTADYYLGVYELTAAQNTVMKTGEAATDANPCRASFNSVIDSIPTYVSHTGLQFGLPTASQWEFACRAGTETDLYTGENIISDTESPNLDAIAWYGYNSGNPAGTLSNVSYHPVGLKQPNGFGLYDMLGNVWEYSHDHSKEYRSWKEYVDHDFGINSSNTMVARHGGSYDMGANHCRATGYLANLKSNANDTQQGVNGGYNGNGGFRLCLPCRAVR